MIRTVIVVLALALTSAFAVPLTTQEYVAAGVQGVSQIQPGIAVNQQTEKTGAQNSAGYSQAQPGFNQPEKFALNSGSGIPEQFTEVTTAQQNTAEKILAQTQTNAYVNQQNFAVPKTENKFEGAEQPQSSYTESPVLLPIQPLSVLPVNSAGQVLQPVVVPAEPIPVGRMIIMAVEPITPKKFEGDVGVVPENQVPYQQVVQPATYTPVQTQGSEPSQQTYYVQPVEEQTLVQQSQNYSPVQVQPNPSSFIRDQATVQQPVGQVSNYNRVPVEQGVYTVQQNSQSVFPQSPENQVPFQVGTVYTQSAVQPLQQQQRYVQQTAEKGIRPYQQSVDNTPVQNQGFVVNPVAPEAVNQNQGLYQQSAKLQTQQQQYNTQQAVEKYVPYQQHQPAGQPVYNVQPVTVEKTENQGQYQVYSSGQPQQQQAPTEQQAVEKRVSCQKPLPVQTNSGESFNQQVYSVQPVTAGQLENQINSQQVTQPQSFEEQVPKSS